MKSTSILYENVETLKKLIDEGNIFADTSYFVRIYTAIATTEEAVFIAKQIKQLLPYAKIIGGSASGIIHNGAQYPDKTLVMIDEFENAMTFTSSFEWTGKSAKEVAEELESIIKPYYPKLVHILCGNHYYDVHNFVEQFNKINNNTKLIGGVCGDILPHNISGYVFDENGAIDEGIMIGAIYSDNLHTYSGVNIAHEAISPKHKLTGADLSLWETINGTDANEWFREQLGIETMQEYSDWKVIADNDVLVRFPLILENHNGASRFIKYDSNQRSISQYFSTVPVGTEFRIGYVSPSECVKESFKICNDLMDQPIETLFCYTCLFRRLYLNNCAEWELSPYKSSNICGAFMMGEISYINGVNEFFNGTCCIIGIAENEKYIRPDIKAFEGLEQIKDDTKDLLHLALRKQSENISKYNELLLDSLIEQQKNSQEQLYLDFNTGIGNYLRYKEDRKTHNFNKMCMVKIENADLLISHLGHDEYIKMTGIAVNKIKEAISGLNEHYLLNRYIFNENTFFMVADERISESHFIELSKKMFESYQFIKISEDSQNVLVCRFAVVIHEEELIESALNTFQVNKNLQSPFLICDKKVNTNFSTTEEFNMIGVLNRALENDGVVPYFQGIYDNKHDCITKYEALMRIVDIDGTVYFPGQFLGIAKKYLLYTHLSKIMMSKVFSLFKNRKEAVSINFSVNDIESKEMQKIIFDSLDGIEDASNFVLEILEDEEFRDIGKLKDFIDKIRKYGVKIAIDDFGSGYSNLLEIAKVNPDYIKVDGSIIREIDHNDMNRRVLDIIVFLGEHLGLDIVAEFVENEKIQKHIRTNNIRYSQGFYFAKPIPYEELNLNEEDALNIL